MLFSELAGYFEKLESISSRLEMIDILAELFRKIKKDEISKTIYVMQGVLAPPFANLKLGVADKIIEDAIALSVNVPKHEIEKTYKKLGDLGLTARQLLEGKSKIKPIGAKDRSVIEIYDTMTKISTLSGKGSKDMKIRLLANLVSASSPQEAKFIVRYALGKLRLGFGDYTILEALSLASTNERRFRQELERAYNICSDLGYVGEILYSNGEEGIKHMKVTLFKPIRPALAERVATFSQIIDKMGGDFAVEQKYDGFRCQIHKKGNEIKIYSRNLDETTSMFPDIVEEVRKSIKEKEIIFEGEAIAFNEDTGEFLPFQETIQRKRVYGIEEKIKQVPLHLFAFDLLYLDGESYLNKEYSKRREALEHALKSAKLISPANRIITGSEKELERFFDESIENGLEGIVAKSLASHYIAGARKFTWIKMKRSYRGELSDTIDLVIIGYYIGKGSRTEFGLGGLLCAVYNKKRDMYETVSKIGTGFSEAEMAELKKDLDQIKSDSKPVRVDALIKPDIWVEPKYIIKVRADEITKSPTHTCGMQKGIGYALRFPRLISDGSAIRKDKSAEDATTTDEIIDMFKQQKLSSIRDT